MKERVLLQDVREEGRIEGIEQGIEQGKEQGIEQGREQTIISQICKKLLKGKDAKIIADEVEEPVDKVTRICEIASKYLPNYDVNKIMEELK